MVSSQSLFLFTVSCFATPVSFFCSVHIAFCCGCLLALPCLVCLFLHICLFLCDPPRRRHTVSSQSFHRPSGTCFFAITCFATPVSLFSSVHTAFFCGCFFGQPCLTCLLVSLPVCSVHFAFYCGCLLALPCLNCLFLHNCQFLCDPPRRRHSVSSQSLHRPSRTCFFAITCFATPVSLFSSVHMAFFCGCFSGQPFLRRAIPAHGVWT